jgi:hypothetical protein
VFKKNLFEFIFFVIVFAVGVFAGITVSSGKNKSDADKYESRLAALTNLNGELQTENQRIADLNTSLTKRLDEITGRLNRASEIVAGFDGQVTSDGETVLRLIDNVSVLEKAFGIIFSSN